MVSKLQKIQSIHSDIEASASWSTQDQSSVYLSDSSADILAKRADLKSSNSLTAQDKSSPLKLHRRERLSPRTAIPKLIPVASIKLHWNKPWSLTGNSSFVQAVAFSPDSKLIASASRDRTVRLWNSATGITLFKLRGHSDMVNAVAFSPDSKLIASASADQTVRLWDSGTGALHTELRGDFGRLYAVAFSPDAN